MTVLPSYHGVRAAGPRAVLVPTAEEDPLIHVDALRQMTFAATPVKELSIVAADGRTLWHTQLRAGNNSCPVVGRDVLIVAAGAKHPSIAHPVTEVVAYSP